MHDQLLRVVIVDDHPIFLSGLRAQFAIYDDIEVVGEFITADAAIEAVPELKPSVTLMDLTLPERAGAEATFCGVTAIREIRHRWSDAGILVVTSYSEPELVREVISAGVCGYLLKQDDPTDFVQKMRLAANGVGVFSSPIRRLLPALVPEVSNGIRPFRQLTNREHDVLDLVARGMTNAEIARRLDVAEKTVANGVSTIISKLGVTDRKKAGELARARGLGRPQNGESPE
ncbi:MAG TPA: response regulator transcription factor [Actinophytocola sp.]|uniref:response regulator transcription factor n=1 Tax=Actinophytocola sp. TaxID=1872138 RepID=UPI002DDCCEE5|nr:response regulator transcription factor [Actinophytocola sp.]HEV2783665.1 response regulator transcription factor [Actinophytocola sp.]